MWRKAGKLIGTVAVVLLLVLQFVQPLRTNPPSDDAASFTAIVKPPPEVVSVLERACHDCHSNQTVWPWYSKLSPVSWLVVQDVREGRAHLNFSEWNRYGPEMSQLRMRATCEEVREGKMPLWYYKPMHPDSKLSARDVDALCAVATTAGLSR